MSGAVSSILQDRRSTDFSIRICGRAAGFERSGPFARLTADQVDGGRGRDPIPPARMPVRRSQCAILSKLLSCWH